MVKLSDFYQQVNDLLPKSEIANAVSIFPLPYSGYYEVFVETKSKKRYRALATSEQTLSNFTEMDFPAQTPKLSGVKHG